MKYSGHADEEQDVDKQCVLCFPGLAWLYQLFVGTLISVTNTYTGCDRPTINFIEHFDLSRSVPTAKPLHLMSVGCSVYMYRLCQTVLHSLCLILSHHSFIIVCDTNKTSENLTFVPKQSLILSIVFVVVIICSLGAMKIKDC